MKLNFSKRDKSLSVFQTCGHKNLFVKSQLDFATRPLFYGHWRSSHRTHHGGLSLSVGCLGGHFEFELVDSRHWNTKKKDWYATGEEEQERQKVLELKGQFQDYLNKAKTHQKLSKEVIEKLEAYVKVIPTSDFEDFYNTFFDIDEDVD